LPPLDVKVVDAEVLVAEVDIADDDDDDFSFFKSSFFVVAI
jgi:hypothetical protein